jgi:hypothetical protein
MIGEKAGKITPNGDVPPGREKKLSKILKMK